MTMLPMTEAPIDPEVLRRAGELEYETFAHGPDLFTVGDHWVTLAGRPDEPACDCGDHAWRGRLCKHVLAALLFVEDPRATAALTALLA